MVMVQFVMLDYQAGYSPRSKTQHPSSGPSSPPENDRPFGSENTPQIHSGWWQNNPSEKYESQLGSLFPIYGKIKVMFETTNQHWLIIIFPIKRY